MSDIDKNINKLIVCLNEGVAGGAAVVVFSGGRVVVLATIY